MEKIFKTIEKNKGPLLISYSRLEDINLPQNTAELYKAACDAGFEAIKGDVAVTKDKKLIMCHDDGFLFDKEGRSYRIITEEEERKAKSISDFTYDECMNIELSMQSAYEKLGYYAKLTDLEAFIKICSENGKIAYITLRDKEIDELVRQNYELLKKYNMVDKCIINSFTFETLEAMRKLDNDIPLSNVFGPNEPLTKDRVDKVYSLGKCAVCAFWAKEEVLSDKLYNKSKEAILYAKAHGVEVHLAHAFDKETLAKGISYGFTAFQCMSTKVLGE